MQSLMIKDLSIAKELDRAQRTAVRGGSTFNNSGMNLSAAQGGSGIGGAATSVVIAPVTQLDASQHLDSMVQTANANSVFGNANAWAGKPL
ncbi:hypothetical protein LZ012_19360 [Dechloromonas sp. XY25]|uniref:Uncharacterized protein n=1 Tax=Dechloromonas hankyongensis TaxID=2908002 RepID=A0ABS9K7K7_9RHOO|nr:hypothetical protein [Dechloromonas hankyongensis]MCG2579154.1 hypothetical protein [Dechloromonas hankyongensis]